MSRPEAGSIVLVDWRGGALPREPTNIRPAVVVDDAELFDDGYPNVLVVPFSRTEVLAVAGLAVRIDPTPENGVPSPCWALPHHVTSVSLLRTRATPSRIADAQLQAIRERILLAIGGLDSG